MSSDTRMYALKRIEELVTSIGLTEMKPAKNLEYAIILMPDRADSENK